MAGRPLTIKPWASAETNYPFSSNPYAGTPVRVQPSADYVTPTGGITAQGFNYAIGILGDAMVGLTNFIGAIPVANFPNRKSINDARAICFDPLGGRWLVAQEFVGVGVEVFTSFDGTVLTLIGATGVGGDSSYQPTAIAGYDSSVSNANYGFGAFAVAYASPTLTSGNTKMSVYSGNTSSFLNTFNVSDSSHTCAISAIAAFSGKFYGFGGGGTSYYNFVGTGSLLAGGTTASGGIISTNPLGSSVAPNKWLAAKNGSAETILLGIPSSSATNKYLSIDTSNTVTVQTGIWSVGEIVTGLAWSDVDQIFMVTTSSALPGATGPNPTTRVYTSTNGVAWLQVATLTSSPLTVSSLTSMGSMWVAVHEDTTNGDTTLYSTNQGVTWFAPYLLPMQPWSGAAMTTGFPPAYSVVISNSDKSQLMMMNRGNIMTSINVGAAGLPVT